jgi:hypothetical protein
MHLLHGVESYLAKEWASRCELRDFTGLVMISSLLSMSASDRITNGAISNEWGDNKGGGSYLQ